MQITWNNTTLTSLGDSIVIVLFSLSEMCSNTVVQMENALSMIIQSLQKLFWEEINSLSLEYEESGPL